MTDATLSAAAPSPAARTRPFYWSVRRELWENRAVYMAPLAVAGLVLVGFLISLHGLVRAARVLSGPKPTLPSEVLAYSRQAMALMMPQYTPAAILVAALIVAVFYSLASLHSERRDRSILFWKSVPISDRTTVLSKAFVTLAVIPPVVFVTMLATQAIMLAIASAVIAANGMDPSVLWSRMQTPGAMIVGLGYGLVALSLWFAPIVGWLMLVSAWAKRMTFLWAVAPPLGVCLVELVAFHTHYAWDFLNARCMNGFAAFTVGGLGKQPIHDASQINVTPFVTDPGLWGGLVFAAAAFAACVWMRRRNDPI